MSAFMVSKDHIDLLVYYAMQQDGMSLRIEPGERANFGPYFTSEYAVLGRLDPNVLGRLLIETNLRSFEARYGSTSTDEDAVIEYRFDPTRLAGLGDADVINAVACYQYQACEHDGHESDIGWRISELILYAAATSLARRTPHKVTWEFTRASIL
ncbi:MAG: hypothetical protein FWG25_09175 [Promicromonosporaceae bacterium]|nr:hypothetical protein [Promicromonosporaceae bacterium]